MAALLTSTHTESTCWPAPAAMSASGKPQVGQRRAAALADQVERLHVCAQTKSLGEIAGEAWTEITRTRADHDGIDVAGADARVAHRPDSRLSRERWRMRREPALQRVRIDCEYFRERIEGQAARGDPVVAQRTASAIACERRSRRANQSDSWKAFQHSALV